MQSENDQSWFTRWKAQHDSQLREYRYTLKLLISNKVSLAGLFIVVSLVFLALFAPWIVPYPEEAVGNIDRANKPISEFKLLAPSSTYLFGTDEMGRDLFSRTIYATRISLRIGLIVIALVLLIGVPLGVIAGTLGGRIDEVIMRVTDLFLGFPSLLLAIAIATALGSGLTNAMIAIALTWWPWYTRLVRSQALSVREQPFVEAARSIGLKRSTIAFRHILPNCWSPVIVQATMDIGYVILTAAGLSFIGLGAKTWDPEWGVMVSSGRLYILHHWWYSVFPGIAIFIAVLGFNLFGDGLRDVLDPRIRR